MHAHQDFEVIPTRGNGPAPLSFGQERIWFIHELKPTDTAYNMAITQRLFGEVDAGSLERALNEIVARHEVLRTRFPAVDGRPTQVVEPSLFLELELLDGDSVTELTRIPFDLAEGPLLRFSLHRLADQDHVLCVVLHHIVADGWSLGVFTDELTSLYNAFRAGQPSPLVPLPIQYGDYASWQRDQLTDSMLDYWRAQLAGVSTLELPADRPRPAVKTTNGDSVWHRLPRELSDDIVRLSRTERCTLFMTLLAAFQILLGRYSGQRDFCVGSPIADRDREELEPVIGFLLNTLVLRADLSGDPTFRELLNRTRATALDAYVHQDLPFERMVAGLDVPRDLSRNALFDVMLNVQHAGDRGLALDGLRAEPHHGGLLHAKVDLTLEVWPRDGELTVNLEYNTDLFDRLTIERMGWHFRTLLEAIVADPGRRLSQLDFMAPVERKFVLEDCNATDADFPAETTLSELIERQVRLTPDATAVVFEDQSLSYAELNARANRLARRLRQDGIGTGSLVAVRAERSLDLVVGLLGILKAGGAYLPLDPDYPADRLAMMLADSQATLLETFDAAGDDSDLPPLARPADVAYVIYTSGSTGRPKGVPNTHRAICNRLDWMQKQFRLGHDDVVLQKTPAGFDVSVWEFFWPLLAGARLVLARPGGHKDAGYLRDLIIAQHVTTLHFVPSMLAVFLTEQGIERCTSLRRTICSGEELPPHLVSAFFDRLPGELHNLYGPTEAAIDVSWWQCSPGDETVPIGRPIQNIQLHVLDEWLNPLPVGIPGELHIGGVGLAQGYLNRPTLTAQRFIANPFGAGRLYKTGDLVRRRADGALEFLGRLDNQVKIRGLRIELGEIESVLREQPGVRDAVAIVTEDKRIVAYVVAADTSQLRDALKLILPDYMVPAAFVQLDALPLSPNGKLDRRALPAPEFGRDSRQEFVSPSTDTELAVATVWREVLGVDVIGLDDDFFDLGGHSLLATQVVARLSGDQPVSVMDLFQRPTIRQLAALLDGEQTTRGLLYELTRPVAPEERVLSLVCVPYGGGNAVVYQPLADALPVGHSLYAVAIPGHDIGLAEDSKPLEEVAQACVDEILAQVSGPLVLYGHCVGGALAAEIAIRLEAAGRAIDAIYMGGIFPLARPTGRVLGPLASLIGLERFKSDRIYADWLTSLGAEMSSLSEDQMKFMVRTLREDARGAERHFTRLFEAEPRQLRAPIISVVGERDPLVEYYQERYREWQFLSPATGLVVLDEAGHYFLKYRAEELAKIVTSTHLDATQLVTETAPTGPEPSMGRFLAVAAGQLVSITGSALTQFALPIWIYQRTGSVVQFAVFAVLGLIPYLLTSPLAGAIVDRTNRRTVMAVSASIAGLIQGALWLLHATNTLAVGHVYVTLVLLSIVLTFQRLAYRSAVPQLVPKRYLGHANGIVQMAFGVAQFLVPLVAVGLIAWIGLGGILLFDVISYVVAVSVLLLVRFPARMAHKRREPLATEIRQGFRYTLGERGLRAMIIWFALLNLFFAPLELLITPLVLSLAPLSTVGQVALFGGLGAAAGGLTMAIWGGPSHRRMRGVLTTAAIMSLSCGLIGVSTSIPVITAGVAGMFFGLAILNGIYATIVQVKVPQRFHGRVFSLNETVAWSTVPLGWALLAPLGTQNLGMSWTYIAYALAMLALSLGALKIRTLAQFDKKVPDALPDDIVGLQDVQNRQPRNEPEALVGGRQSNSA